MTNCWFWKLRSFITHWTTFSTLTSQSNQNKMKRIMICLWMMNENFDISILKETGHTSDIIQVLYQRKIQWAIDTDLIGWSSDNDNGGFHHLLVLQSCDNAHLEIKASLTFWISSWNSFFQFKASILYVTYNEKLKPKVQARDKSQYNVVKSAFSSVCD